MNGFGAQARGNQVARRFPVVTSTRAPVTACGTDVTRKGADAPRGRIGDGV
jgi:hypothetical protein